MVQKVSSLAGAVVTWCYYRGSLPIGLTWQVSKAESGSSIKSFFWPSGIPSLLLGSHSPPGILGRNPK